MLQIGPYKLSNPVALAPMAGVTDLPFRRLCSAMGAGLVVSEMISSDPGLRDTRKTLWRSHLDEAATPRSVQIAGNDPARMAEAARYNVERGAQVIDINMGCPAKKVCRKAAGSALLQDEPLVQAILRAVVAAVEVPVTLKIRTGANPEQRNGISIARIAEDAGISALAVHGRTRACAFKGEVEYDTIADIVSATDFPVFANGDIATPEQAAQVLNSTGAAGIMVGRAAQGQPWLLGQIAARLSTGATPAAPSLERQSEIVIEHVRALHSFYGDFMGVRIARKHVSWYLQQRFETTPGAGVSRRKAFNQLASITEQLQFLEQFFQPGFNEVIAA